MKRAHDKGFDSYSDAERIRDYQAKPYSLRLLWLYQGNLFRKAYPKRIIRRHETLRRVKK